MTFNFCDDRNANDFRTSNLTTGLVFVSILLNDRYKSVQTMVWSKSFRNTDEPTSWMETNELLEKNEWWLLCYFTNTRSENAHVKKSKTSTNIGIQIKQDVAWIWWIWVFHWLNSNRACSRTNRKQWNENSCLKLMGEKSSHFVFDPKSSEKWNPPFKFQRSKV